MESRQFPVTVHFNKRTAFEDYVDEAYRKICKIHRQLPDGGILVFLTGQQEVNSLCAKLRRSFPATRRTVQHQQQDHQDGDESQQQVEDQPDIDDGEQDPDEDDMDKVMERIRKRKQMMKKKIRKQVDDRPRINLDYYSALPLQDQEVEANDQDPADDDGDDEEDDVADEAESLSQSRTAPPLWVLPLYSLLPSHRQQKVFQAPPEGSRYFFLTKISPSFLKKQTFKKKCKFLDQTVRRGDQRGRDFADDPQHPLRGRHGSSQDEILRQSDRSVSVPRDMDFAGGRRSTSRSSRSNCTRSLLPLVFVGRFQR